MTIQIVAARLEGGTGHEHITQLWWVAEGTSQENSNTRAQIVSWIENEGGKAYTDDGRGNRAIVAVVTPANGPKYLRTYADGVWNNNLLALPRR